MGSKHKRGVEMKRQSLFMDFLYRFKKNKLAVTGLIILISMTMSAVFADYITPYGYNEQNPAAAFQFPNSRHWLGTDEFGRDILSRIIYSTRVSLKVAFFAVGIAVFVGGIIGAIAAYYSKLDNFIMRTVDLFMAIPNVLLAIAIATALGSGEVNLMIAVGVSSVPMYARIVRAAVLTVKEQEYIEAAISIGASDKRIILGHIIPNALSPVIVQATLSVASAIILASSLSYLGFGVKAPKPEWGAMLSSGRQYIRTYWHLTIFPGIAIMAAVYALNVVGDGLRDALDPRMKQ